MQDPGNITTQNAFVVQTMPEIRERIMKGKNWPEICRYQLENQFSDDGRGAKKDMERMMKLYTSEVFEDFLEDPKCQECGELATQRCSRCKNAWYCSRDCQLRQWKKHKPLCELHKRDELRKEANEAIAKNEMEKQGEQASAKRKRPLIQEMD